MHTYIHTYILGRWLAKIHVTRGQLFNFMDDDRSDNITFGEFTRGLALALSGKNVPLPSDDELRCLFNSFDVDHGNSVSYSEMVRALPGLSEQSGIYVPRNAGWRGAPNDHRVTARDKKRRAPRGMTRGTMIGSIYRSGGKKTWDQLIPITPPASPAATTAELGITCKNDIYVNQEPWQSPQGGNSSRGLPTPLERLQESGILDRRYSLDRHLYNTRHSVAGMQEYVPSEVLPRPLPMPLPAPTCNPPVPPCLALH